MIHYISSIVFVCKDIACCFSSKQFLPRFTMANEIKTTFSFLIFFLSKPTSFSYFLYLLLKFSSLSLSLSLPTYLHIFFSYLLTVLFILCVFFLFSMGMIRNRIIFCLSIDGSLFWAKGHGEKQFIISQLTPNENKTGYC